MRHHQLATLLLALCVAAPAAQGLPRFAARNGGECIQCHVNPTGGGVRNEYGRNVFEHAFLPLSARRSAPPSWLADELLESERKAQSSPGVQFSGDLTDWLAIGGDIRAAYILIRPDEGPTPGAEREITSSFFLMQADLYHTATVNEHVQVVVDVGAYSGFEAWALIKPRAQLRSRDVVLKVGRFLPPFGVREVEHQLFTREAVGLGATDRDTGLELTGYLNGLTLNLALLNGTLGDTPFDNAGKDRRSFEKALASRVSLRGALGGLRAQVGGSLYWNQNISQANPLFGGVLPPALQAGVGDGLDELRLGGFLTANLGRFTYLADVVYVRDRFYTDPIPDLAGYASYQELSFLPMQGLDVVGTFEFKEPDTEVAGDSTMRAGLVFELFPWPMTEVRAMVRRTFGDGAPTGGVWDGVLFAHFFL